MNPSSMKQALIEGATRLNDNNMFEQGYGKLNILRSMKILSNYVPKVTLSPPYLDCTEDYMWPYSTQSLFHTSMPLIVNVTILNGMGVTGRLINQPTWHPYTLQNGNLLNVSISYSDILWPWSGWMALKISKWTDRVHHSPIAIQFKSVSLSPPPAVNEMGEKFEGLAQGHITLTVQSPAGPQETEARNSTVSLPIRMRIIARPSRQKRILWDQYHSLRYPPGYLPRDNLKMKSDPLDWRADHIHTNFKDMYTHLRNAGYYVEVLGEPITCFNAAHYGTLLIVDPEEEYFETEIAKLREDILERNMSLIVFADWYNASVMRKIQFYDENTRQWWMPDTGGANIPALNELLGQFGIAFGDVVTEGYFTMGDHGMYYASGTSLIRFPQTSRTILIERELNNQGAELLSNDAKTRIKRVVPILGMLQVAKSDIGQNVANVRINDYNADNVETGVFDTLDVVEPDALQNVDKNPIVNKRVLLSQVALNNDQLPNEIDANEAILVEDIDTNRTEQVVVVEVPQSVLYRNKENIKRQASIDTQPVSPTEGRIVVYGDSNCLDSTHAEKPCFWLLDAMLEYTMSSHVSSLLRDLNRSSSIRFDAEPIEMPKRLPNNNLHLYSKVLTMSDATGATGAHVVVKRDNPKCADLIWATPICLNLTAPSDLQYQNGREKDESDADGVANIAMNLRRKLESQKGEVRSVFCAFGFQLNFLRKCLIYF